MTITQLISSIFESAKNRIKTPFVGSFIISWFVINWPAVAYYVRSDKDIETVIPILLQKHNNCWELFFLPFLYASGYLILSPIIFYFFEWSTKYFTEKRKDFKALSLQGDRQREAQIAKEEFLVAQAKSGSREIEELQNQIYSLDNEKLILNETVTSLRAELSSKTEDQAKIIKDIEGNNNRISELNREINSIVGLKFNIQDIRRIWPAYEERYIALWGIIPEKTQLLQAADLFKNLPVVEKLKFKKSSQLFNAMKLNLITNEQLLDQIEIFKDISNSIRLTLDISDPIIPQIEESNAFSTDFKHYATLESLSLF